MFRARTAGPHDSSSTACSTDARFDSCDVTESCFFEGPEGLDADIVSGSVAEDDAAPGQAIKKRIEPTIASDHGASDAEVSQADVLAGHGCYAACCYRNGADCVDGRV